MKRILRIIVLSGIFPCLIFAQFSERVFYLRSISVDAGGNFQTWKVGDTKLSETSFPLQVVLPISDQMSVSISNIPVLISRTATDTAYEKVGNTITSSTSTNKTTLNTLTDTRIGFKYIFLNNKALLNLSANIPTGKKEMEDASFGLSTQLGLGILKYRMPVLGQGLNFGGSFIYAMPLNKRNILGFGLSYNVKTKYTPVKSVDYDAGDDYGVSLSYIYTPTSNLKMSCDAAYTNYAKDKISFTTLSSGVEKKIDMEFQSGYRINIVAQASLKTGAITHWLVFQDKIRGNNRQQTLKVIDNDFFYDWKDVTNGQQFEASYNLTTPLTPYLTFSAQALLRMFGSGQDNWNGIVIQSDNSSVYGGGAGLRIQLMDNLGLDITGKYLTGKIKLGQEYDVSGFDVYAKFNILF
jgi:hypothetical protein